MVQQPLAASNLQVVPEPTSEVRREGLIYHVLPTQAVAAGDLYEVKANYTMSVPQLTNSADSLPVLEVTPVEDEEDGFDWQPWLIGGGLVILAGAAAFYFSNRQKPRSRRPAKPKPTRKKTAVAQANFCRECGNALEAEDKFCRGCGTAVKTNNR